MAGFSQPQSGNFRDFFFASEFSPQLWWFWILCTKAFQTTLCALFSCVDSFMSTVVGELNDDNPSSINVSTLLGGTGSAHVVPQHSSLYLLVVEKALDPMWQKLAGIPASWRDHSGIAVSYRTQEQNLFLSIGRFPPPCLGLKSCNIAVPSFNF